MSQEALSVTSSLPALSTGEPSQGSGEDQSATSKAGQIGIGETESAAGQPTHSTRDTDEAPFDPWADPDQKPLLNLVSMSLQLSTAKYTDSQLRLVTGQLSLAGAFHGAAR